VGDDITVDIKTPLLTDFVNLKIKSTQSFRCVHRGRMCVRVFIGVSDRMCMSICVYTVFLKNIYHFDFYVNFNYLSCKN
jgi:hypothetical protein